MLKGPVHPDLALGFEVVAEAPMDGTIDAEHIRLVQPDGETALFRVISVEDLIADRMGQYAWARQPIGSSRRAFCWLFAPPPIRPILTAASARKAWASMASETFTTETGETVIRMGEFGRRIAARKPELGLPDPPRNAGQNRTASKRALLKAIEEMGGKW